MNAFHTLWTKPCIKDRAEYCPENYEVLTMLLSALEWRRYNGTITLVTDTIGARFFNTLGISSAWNKIDISLDEISPNAEMFWAAGKIYALSKQTTPVCMIDNDFIVWDKILFENIKEPLAVIHDEELNRSIYPDKAEFMSLLQKFNASVKPVNTAFAYIADLNFLNEYTRTAINFMENAPYRKDSLTYMLFAEQRLFSMCADYLGKKVYKFSTLEKLFRNGENYFTHLWGFKQQLRDKSAIKKDFCAKCAARIKSDFPEYSDCVDKILCMN